MLSALTSDLCLQPLIYSHMYSLMCIIWPLQDYIWILNLQSKGQHQRWPLTASIFLHFAFAWESRIWPELQLYQQQHQDRGQRHQWEKYSYHILLKVLTAFVFSIDNKTLWKTKFLEKRGGGKGRDSYFSSQSQVIVIPLGKSHLQEHETAENGYMHTCSVHNTLSLLFCPLVP